MRYGWREGDEEVIMYTKDFERKIADKLREYRPQLPDGMMERIERSLADGKGAIRPVHDLRRRVARYGVAAAVMLVAGTVLYLTVDRRPEPENVVVVSDAADSKGSLHVIAAVDAGSGGSDLHENVGIVEAGMAEALNDNEVAVATGDVRLLSHEEAPTVGIWLDDGSESAVPAVPDIALSAVEERREVESGEADSLDRTDGDGQGSAVAFRVQEQWREAIADSRKVRGGRKVAGALHVGNFGTANHMSHNPDMAASDGMLVAQAFDGSSSLLPVLTADDGRQVLAAVQPATEDVELQHRMPLSVGITLAIPLTDRLSILTGVDYSYLVSTSSQTFSTSGSCGIVRELHYLGIPVGVAYTFGRAGGFGFYVRGGGMIEKGVAWREKYSFASDGDSGTDTSLRGIGGVQLSVNAAVGAEYYFGRHVGVYVEPGVSYYFHNDAQPASYRTAHPVNFSIRLGVKLGM